MPPEPRCRDYQAEDWAAVKALWQATGLDHPQRGDSAALVERTLAQGGRLLVLEAEDGGPLAGAVWLTQDGRRFYLHHFAIRPDLQGRGLGRALLDQALAAIRPAGLQVKLEVHRDNLRAQRLYRGRGFKPVAELDVLMLRDLAEVDRSGGRDGAAGAFSPRPAPDRNGAGR